VLRYRPEQGARRRNAYTVPFSHDLSVLQALQHVKDELDGTLSFRWSCRMASAAACGMMVNGKPALSCQPFVRSCCPGPVRIEALAHFPIERDLVVNIGASSTSCRASSRI
jgi:fumarate reductase iron-sulfur subunit